MIDLIKSFTWKDWVEFVLGLVAAACVVVFIWAALWIGCALNDKCYCDNTNGGDVVCQQYK